MLLLAMLSSLPESNSHPLPPTPPPSGLWKWQVHAEAPKSDSPDQTLSSDT